MKQAIGICKELISQYQGERSKWKIKISQNENPKWCAEEIIELTQKIHAVQEVIEALESTK